MPVFYTVVRSRFFSTFATTFLQACFITVLFSLSTAQDVLGASSTRILTKRGSPVLISAASMFGDSEKQTVELVGDVQMTFDGQSLRADRATMDKSQGIIRAEGNIVIASATAYVEGSRAEISYEDNTGLIFDGFVKSGQVIFQGKVLRKVGVDKYEAEKASYTACTTCPPAWSFSGRQIDAEIGAYAHIKSATFYLGGVPFFWLPYLIVPLKSERQTGLLFPSYEFDIEGYAIGIPFFWAISRSQDVTFTPKYYTERGFKGALDYRYILNEESGGQLTLGGLLKDSIFSRDISLPNRPGDERSGRWFLSHNHLYTLPGGFINRARLAFVSDLRYTRDFPEDILGLGEAALENRLSLTKNTERLHSSVEVAYYVNQLKKDPLEGNSDSVHRFPELKQSGTDRSLFGTRLFLKWDFNYVNFSREDIAFDDVILTGNASTPKDIDRTRGSGGTGSGTFEPGTDLIRTGQRLDLRPEISAPFRIGRFVDVLPTIQFRHTQYSFNVSPPDGSAFDTLPSRQYVRGRFALRTQMSRIYGSTVEPLETADGYVRSTDDRLPASGESEAASTGIFQALQKPFSVPRPEPIKHEIEPEISISGIPWIQQTQSPFFSDNALSPIFIDGQPVSNSDFYSTKGLQFDYEDRITQRNVVSMLVTNRFIQKTWDEDRAVYRQTISIKNGTSYEFDRPNRDANSNFSDIFTIVDARFKNFDSNTSVRYFPLHRVFNTSARARVIDDRGNFLQASYSQNFLITENVQEAYPSREENIGFSLGFIHRYASISGDLNFQPVSYAPVSLKLKSWAAVGTISPPGDCWGVRVAITHVLTEEKPRYIFGFEYNFGGSS